MQNKIWHLLRYWVSCIDIRKNFFSLPFEPDSFLYHSANSNVILLNKMGKTYPHWRGAGCR
jgi:transposase